MTNIVLLDDVDDHNGHLAHQIREICLEEKLEANIVMATSSIEKVLDYARKNDRTTVYFLDIELNDVLNGVQLCDVIQSYRLGDYFVYVSAYPHYAYSCLKSHAFDFLLKPFTRAELKECLRALRKVIEQKDKSDRIGLTVGSREYYVSLSEIIYITAKGKTIDIHTTRGRYALRRSLTSFLAELNSQSFLQIHRGHAINIAHIEAYEDEEDRLIMDCGVALPVSRRMRAALTDRIVIRG